MYSVGPLIIIFDPSSEMNILYLPPILVSTYYLHKVSSIISLPLALYISTRQVRGMFIIDHYGRQW